jgi:hypothetical protein
MRDASRIRVQFFAQDTDPTGSGPAMEAVTPGSDSYVCVFDGPTWSGFTRGDVETTCTETALDGWGNLVRKYRPGMMIDFGTITFTVDWDPDNQYGGREFAAFMDGRVGDLKLYFPPEGNETTGPILTLTGYCNNFTPAGTVLTDDNASRSSAQLVYKLNNISVTAPA